MGTFYDYSTDASANVSLGGIDVGENCPAANLNNAIRRLMADARSTLQQELTLPGLIHVSPGPITASGRLRVLSRSDTAGEFAISTYSTVNYHAVQFVREILGTASERGSIYVTDLGVTYGSLSDRELKHDDGLVSPEQAWEIVRLIQIHNFRWKEGGAADVGTFAQELWKVYPRAVVPGGWFDAEGNPANAVTLGATYRRWFVDNSKLVPVMIVALQHVDARQKAIEDRLAKLEAA